MTNWYSPTIKANLAELLKGNPDPQDVRDWVIANADPNEFLGFTDDDIIDYVITNYGPAQVFDQEELEDWAYFMGWHTHEDWKVLVKAIQSLDGLLSADLKALEPWQKEIDELYEVMDLLCVARRQK